ncbi:hypothetical protein EYF80_064912 [Liparis tanakae]|uniref:Uncharacterized protein n=1 Tax=Liparis tanakae TaxID=230148 RepID=A0A4Z2E8R6_9TELE|nr:hypothetical protein EYF80_064912 [Liparis tanakae]
MSTTAQSASRMSPTAPLTVSFTTLKTCRPTTTGSMKLTSVIDPNADHKIIGGVESLAADDHRVHVAELVSRVGGGGHGVAEVRSAFWRPEVRESASQREHEEEEGVLCMPSLSCTLELIEQTGDFIDGVVDGLHGVRHDLLNV